MSAARCGATGDDELCDPVREFGRIWRDDEVCYHCQNPLYRRDHGHHWKRPRLRKQGWIHGVCLIDAHPDEYPAGYVHD